MLQTAEMMTASIVSQDLFETATMRKEEEKQQLLRNKDGDDLEGQEDHMDRQFSDSQADSHGDSKSIEVQRVDQDVIDLINDNIDRQRSSTFKSDNPEKSLP